MSTINSFKDLKVWEKSHLLALNVYRITESFPHKELYGLTSQIRRSIISVPSNIVEGFHRRSINEGVYFYRVALASLEEAKYQLLFARDFKYIDSEKYNEIVSLFDEVGKMLNGWIKSQKNNKN